MAKKSKEEEIHDAVAEDALDKTIKDLESVFEEQRAKLKHTAKQLEENYIKTKRAECENLHNKLVNVIGEVRPSPINLLFVLEILRQEALTQSMNLFFAPVPESTNSKG